MRITFRQPVINDLERIIEIEHSGFSPEEAATKEAMAERINTIPDSFILAVNESEELMGYVVGSVISERYLYDELFEKTAANPQCGGYQTILSLAVDPTYRKFGVASQLLAELANISQKNKRKGITLTCLEKLIPFYEKNGYQLDSISESQHAGETWYNMLLDL